MDLARELSALAAHVEWPATPELRLDVDLEPRAADRRSRRRRPVALALAFALVVAIAAALTVPQSRGAILRFFHLGAATIVGVDRLPAAQERPLSAGIGPAVSLAAAHHAFRGTLLVPQVEPPAQAHLTDGNVVSFLFADRGRPVLLSEFALGGGFMKKFAGLGTSVQDAGFDGAPGLYLSGLPHDFIFPGLSPRLAGDVLIWERHDTTYRLESGTLTREEAITLARALTRG
jgi:hypothetical protein